VIPSLTSLAALVMMTVAVSPSGAMSPGPLTASTIVLGGRSGGWRAGVLVALGHTLAELPYVTLLCIAFRYVGSVLQGPAGAALVVAAAVFITYFAVLLIRDALKPGDEAPSQAESSSSRSVVSGGLNPVLTGFLLTALNAYFLLWWVSAGLTLIVTASSLGVVGVAVMYVSHVWLDYAWLGAMGEIGGRGAALIGSRGYRVFLGVMAAILLFFALNMVSTRFLGISFLP